MRAAARIALIVVGALALAPSALGAPEPWEAASQARDALSNAETELVLDGPDAATRYVGVASEAVGTVLEGGLGAGGRLDGDRPRLVPPGHGRGRAR